jgi:hypothetical protein
VKSSKAKARKPARQEFGAPPRAKALARSSRRGQVQRRPVDFGDVTGVAAAHGEDIASEREKPLPREDRAG